jgi:hypothetical protein
MKFSILIAVAVSMLSSACFAQDDPKIADLDPNAILFPDPLGPVSPSPAPVDSAILLTQNQVFVIQSEVEFDLVQFPEKSVLVTFDTAGADSPYRIRGVFADDPGRTQTRIFRSKYLAIVEPIEGKSGRVELVAVPFGYSKRGSFTRRFVDLGVAPRPPPIPDVPPVPTPDVPPVPKPTGDFRVIMIWETSANNSDDTLRVFMNPEITRYLTANCVTGPGGVADWRKWDKDTTPTSIESPELTKMWAGIKPLLGDVTLPQIAVGVGTDVKLIPLPKTVAETLELLKKYKEGR